MNGDNASKTAASADRIIAFVDRLAAALLVSWVWMRRRKAELRRPGGRATSSW